MREIIINFEMNLLLRTSHSSDNLVKPADERPNLDPMETLEDMFDWLVVFWQRGLCHGNPQVRCLIMQSVFGIEWKNHGNYAKFVPRDFILGPFVQGLNDPVHHKEFRLKGVYSSRTINVASTFLQQYSVCLSEREQMRFLGNLASLVKNYSFGRAGLMSLAECVAAAGAAFPIPGKTEVDVCVHVLITRVCDFCYHGVTSINGLNPQCNFTAISPMNDSQV